MEPQLYNYSYIMFSRLRTFLQNVIPKGGPNVPQGGGPVGTILTATIGVGLGAYGLYNSVVTGIILEAINSETK